jgi:hypothetical protein
MTDEETIKIHNKQEYIDVQNKLLSEGYVWIDGFNKFYDLYEFADSDFYQIRFVVHHETKTFEWRFPE